MSSERRIESSQANGALSQGPVTPEGKRRSSRNALKHGMYSGTILINGESPELYEEVRGHFFARYQPTDKTEEYLVEEMVACHWRMNRCVTMEAATLDLEIDAQQSKHQDSFESTDASTQAARAFKELTEKNSTLATFRRFETTFGRQFDRAARRLEALQAKSKKCGMEPSLKDEK